MRNAHCMTWIWARKLKNWKMRTTPCTTWNMAKKKERRRYRKKEKPGKTKMHTVGPGMQTEN